jgi:hypothetical protein
MDKEIYKKLKQADIPIDGNKINFEELFLKIEKEKKEFESKKFKIIEENKLIYEKILKNKDDL